jgi:hypothetical protein
MKKYEYLEMSKKDYEIRKNIQMLYSEEFNYVKIKKFYDAEMEYEAVQFEEILFNQSGITSDIPESKFRDFDDESKVELFEYLSSTTTNLIIIMIGNILWKKRNLSHDIGIGHINDDFIFTIRVYFESEADRLNNEIMGEIISDCLSEKFAIKQFSTGNTITTELRFKDHYKVKEMFNTAVPDFFYVDSHGKNKKSMNTTFHDLTSMCTNELNSFINYKV